MAIKGWEEDARAGKHGRRPAPETTIRTRLEHLRLLAKSIGVGPWEVTGEQMCAWFAGRPWAANTYRSRRTTYRAFYAWAVREGYVAISPAHDIPPGEVPQVLPKPVPDRHWDRALAEATPRERLMVRLAGEHGMRRSEVAQVHPERDMFEDLAGWSLIVHGKGGRDRVVPLLDDVARELRRLGPGYAFPGKIDGHLSPRWVGTVVGRLLPADYGMHKLRHRAGTKWLDETENLALVQDLLGHEDPKTTRAYTRVNAARMREAVKRGAVRRG